MRYLIVFAVIASGCSYNPVVDLRVSEDKAQLYQRDLLECRSLIRHNASGVYPFNDGVRNKMLDKCLSGRGHSVLSIGG